MRLAISNIAWPSGEDDAVAPLLIEHHVEGVEIAPTKIWPRPLDVDEAEVAAYRDRWEQHGLRVVALQALLFGHPELTIFNDPATRRRTLEYLMGMITLAARLGAEALVFGSPKNRRVGPLSRDEAEAIAVPFFRELGRVAALEGVTFCIEPNPESYGCDYITRADEGVDLVRRVGCEGFGLHLDTGAMTLAGDPCDSIFAQSGASWRHFHISEPELAPVGRGGGDHPSLSSAVHRAGYSRWASIEMKEVTSDRPWDRAIGESLAFVNDVYFSRKAG